MQIESADSGMAPAKILVLMGIKHCGKSTHGKRLAALFGCSFYDTDDIIKDMSGMSPRELYSSRGENVFKKAEADACCRICAELDSVCSDTSKQNINNLEFDFSAVVATGGGICNNKSALDVLHKIGTFVFLCADECLASDRIAREVLMNQDGSLSGVPAYIAKKNPHTISDVRTIFHDFYVERSELYRQVADVSVNMLPVSKKENTSRILAALKSY